jgi:hypothetical protein
MKRWKCSSGFWRRVDSSVDVNVSEKHTVSIFRTEVAMLRSGGIYIGLEEGEAGGGADQGRGVRGRRFRVAYSALQCLRKTPKTLE